MKISRPANSTLFFPFAVLLALIIPLLTQGCSKNEAVQGTSKIEAPKPVGGVMQHSEEKTDR